MRVSVIEHKQKQNFEALKLAKEWKELRSCKIKRGLFSQTIPFVLGKTSDGKEYLYILTKENSKKEAKVMEQLNILSLVFKYEKLPQKEAQENVNRKSVLSFVKHKVGSR